MGITAILPQVLQWQRLLFQFCEGLLQGGQQNGNVGAKVGEVTTITLLQLTLERIPVKPQPEMPPLCVKMVTVLPIFSHKVSIRLFAPAAGLTNPIKYPPNMMQF